MNLKYKKVLLKLSGEILLNKDDAQCIDSATVEAMATKIKTLRDLGCSIAVVLGGGNIFRGALGEKLGISRSSGDYMGMLATVINGLALQNALENIDVPTRVQTAIEMRQIAEPFIQRKAVRHLEKGRVVIFAAGTGNPYFSTDTAAALRACEIGADVLIKATKVDGVYTADPKKDPTATRIPRITFTEVLDKSLRVMDPEAFSLCRTNNIPIMVLDFFDTDALERAVTGAEVGTLVTN
jgi:uridylate kinase